jgi:hypothetical protein
LKIRLLGGLLLQITTMYCSPRGRTGNGRGSAGGGLYPELSAFRINEGCTPAMQAEVARLVAQMPLAQAQCELARRGLHLNEKTIWRIAKGAGVQLLATRTRDVLAWRDGHVLPGHELRGKRIAVQIDGGRVRTRHPSGPRKGKQKRAKFDTPWREPKLLIIYELDQHGRMKRGTRAWIDATLEGPDALMELLAYHLHRLGAAEAESVTFVSDGGPWIWDRLDWVCRRVGLKSGQVECVIDWCHATHHISLALAALGLSEKTRAVEFRRLRGLLKQGRHAEVMAELRRLAQGASEKSDVWGESAFLEKHSGHMRYAFFRRKGLPIGSGAIESTVRRLVNLRLKGNGIFWREENAEGLLVLRAALITDRWDETLSHARDAMARDRRKCWKWEPPDALKEMKAPLRVNPPRLQLQSLQAPMSIAA